MLWQWAATDALSAACCGPPLLAAGADAHYVNERGNTCLHRAAAHKYPVPVLCLLIRAGADLQAVNSAGKTAAQVAADSGNALAAALLNRAAGP
jgi:ankyrin repeat protein